MPVDGFKALGAACLAVICSGIGFAVTAGAPSGALTLAGPEVLRLVQSEPAALSSYPAVRMTGRVIYSINGRMFHETMSGLSSPDGQRGTATIAVPELGRHVTVIGINHRLYMQLPRPRGGAHYAWCNLPTRSSSGLGVGVGGADPLTYVRLMPGATGGVKVVGHQTIDGARTTEYEVDIDLPEAVQRLQQEGSATAASVQELQQLGVTTMPYDVWIDAQKAVRQFGWHLSVHGFSVKEQFRLSGATTPATVTEPAASDAYYVDNCNILAGAAWP